VLLTCFALPSKEKCFPTYSAASTLNTSSSVSSSFRSAQTQGRRTQSQAVHEEKHIAASLECQPNSYWYCSHSTARQHIHIRDAAQPGMATTRVQGALPYGDPSPVHTCGCGASGWPAWRVVQSTQQVTLLPLSLSTKTALPPLVRPLAHHPACHNRSLNPFQFQHTFAQGPSRTHAGGIEAWSSTEAARRGGIIARHAAAAAGTRLISFSKGACGKTLTPWTSTTRTTTSSSTSSTSSSVKGRWEAPRPRMSRRSTCKSNEGRKTHPPTDPACANLQPCLIPFFRGSAGPAPRVCRSHLSACISIRT